MNSFIPMPETFRKYDTTNHPNGERLEIGQHLGFDEKGPNVTQDLIDEYKAATKEQQENYGVVGWYAWGRKYWGTKWDAGFNIIRLSETQASINSMETAYNMPHPFFNTLSERFPKITFEVSSHFEDNGNLSLLISNGASADITGLKKAAIERYLYKAITEEGLQKKLKIFINQDYYEIQCTPEENEKLFREDFLSVYDKYYE